MKTKQNPGDYLQFSKKDRIAILIIASILLTAFLLPSFLEHSAPVAPVTADTAWISAMRKLENPVSETTPYIREEQKAHEDYKYDRVAGSYNNEPQAQLFNFDPNSLDDAGWKRLGLRDKTIATIRKYVEKGGRFRNPEDLRKIYGLRPDLAERLVPYIRINSTVSTPLPMSRLIKREAFFAGNIDPVDINTGDSLAFERLPGIGPVLASRIIRFRDKLGGFYEIRQISETFGISDSTFTAIRSYLRVNEHYDLKKISINSVELNELRKHPYIKYPVATAIINYRTQHGIFSSAEKLKQLSVIDDVLYKKLIPYLSFSQ